MQQIVMNPDEDPLANPVLGLRSGSSGTWDRMAVTPSDNPDIDPFGIEMRTPLGEMPSLPDMRYDPELQVNVPVGSGKRPAEIHAGTGPPPPPKATRCGWIYPGTRYGFYSYEDPKWVIYYP